MSNQARALAWVECWAGSIAIRRALFNPSLVEFPEGLPHSLPMTQ